MADDLTLSTAPTSKRFPTTNQAKACYMYYNSWHQCKYDYSDEEPQCAKLKGWAMSMCPIEWVRARAVSCHKLFFGWRPVACFERRPSPYALPGRAQVENWEKQRESGTYPGPVPGEKKGGDHH